MYRFYLIILFLVVTTVDIFAQKTVDRATYESAVDHLNCELAKFYMFEDVGQYIHDEYLEYSTTYPCNYENLMVFIQRKQPQLERNGYLATYIESFKKEYDEQITNGALYNKLMEVFNPDSLTAHGLVSYDGNESYEKLKFGLKEDYLKETLKPHELETNNGIKDTQEEAFSFWEWLRKNLLLIIFSALFLFFFFTIFRWARKYANTGKDKLSKKDLAAHRIKPQIPADTQTVNEKLKPKLPKSPKPKVATVAKTGLEKEAEAVIKGTPQKAEEVEAEPEELIFYMPYPSIDGSFYELENSEIEIPGESTFKFKLVSKKYSMATFELITNRDIIMDIVMDHERTIKSVCEIKGKNKKWEEVIRSGITKIITVEPGIVQKTTRFSRIGKEDEEDVIDSKDNNSQDNKRAGHWRLKKKAIIRFEYE